MAKHLNNLTPAENREIILASVRGHLAEWTARRDREAEGPKVLLGEGYIGYINGAALLRDHNSIMGVPCTATGGGYSMWDRATCERMCALHAADFRPVHVKDLPALRIAELTEALAFIEAFDAQVSA